MIMLITVCFQFLVHIKRLKEKFHLSLLKFLQHRAQAPVHIHTCQADKCMPGQIMSNRAFQSALCQIDVFRIQISDHMNRASRGNSVWIARTGKPEIFVVIPWMVQTNLTRLDFSIHGLHRNQETGVFCFDIHCPLSVFIPIEAWYTFQLAPFLQQFFYNQMDAIEGHTPVLPLLNLFHCKTTGKQVIPMYSIYRKYIEHFRIGVMPDIQRRQL